MARSNAVAKIREIASTSRMDARGTLLKAIGDLSKEQVLHSQVLVALYIQPEQTRGGIFLPDKELEEDRFQGTCGLVIAMGPGAFKDDGIAKFHGVTVKLHDWCMFRPADGMQLLINQVPCRLFEDVNIKMRVSDPQRYW